jgi:HEAT repeat protein
LRKKVIYALGAIHASQTVAALRPAFADNNPEVRYSAAQALGQLGRPEAVTPLIALLKDPGSNVGRSAAWALVQLDKAQVVMPLIEQLKIQSGTVLRSILLTLGRLGDLRARDAVLVIYNNHTEKDSRVKRTAAAALLAFHQQDGLGLLTRLAQSTNINDELVASFRLHKTLAD